jgi:hypothetical protein
MFWNETKPQGGSEKRKNQIPKNEKYDYQKINYNSLADQ